MSIRIQSKKDLYAGAIFVFFGTVAILVASRYPMGTALRMGPAYFPIILGILLNLLGLVLTARGLWARGEPINGWAYRPLLFVLVAILLFGLLIESIGLAMALLILVFVSRLGSSEFGFREVGALALVLALLGLAIFVFGLDLPFKVWPI